MKRLALVFLAAVLAVFSFAQVTVSVKTADYAVVPADQGSIIVMNSASARTVYLPGPSPSQIGFTVTVQKRGAGNLTIRAAGADYIADSGVGQYIRNTTAGETYASITLVYVQANRWLIQAASGTWATDTSTMIFGANTKALLDAKAPLASPTFTGTVTLPSAVANKLSFAVTTESGLRLNNLTAAQRTAIAAPLAGDLVWNADAGRVNVYTGSAWTDGWVRLGGDTMTGGLSFSVTTASGLRLNNLTTTQRDAISGPAAGDIVWNTSTGRANVYTGSVWTSGWARLEGDTFTGNVTVGTSASPATLAGSSYSATVNNGEVGTTTISGSVVGLLIVDAGNLFGMMRLQAGATLASTLTSSTITATKDTASKINIYCEDGVVKVQNNTASPAAVKILLIKAI